MRETSQPSGHTTSTTPPSTESGAVAGRGQAQHHVVTGRERQPSRCGRPAERTHDVDHAAQHRIGCSRWPRSGAAPRRHRALACLELDLWPQYLADLTARPWVSSSELMAQPPTKKVLNPQRRLACLELDLWPQYLADLTARPWVSSSELMAQPPTIESKLGPGLTELRPRSGGVRDVNQASARA